MNNEKILADAWDDFNGFNAKKDFVSCRAIQDNLGDLGFEMDALRMHKIINVAEKNAAIALENSKLVSKDDGKGIKWSPTGFCCHCGKAVDPYATACSKCHYSFTD